METAMEIILNDLKLKYKIYEDANLYNLASALETSIDLASKLLELEKQQTIEAYNDGLSSWDNTDDFTGKDYYEHKFKNK